MSRIVLYLGGMGGDLLIGCLNPSQLESIDKIVNINPDHGRLKKFWQMTQSEKTSYINSYNDDIFLSSHDTEFSLNHIDKTIRIYCSDYNTLVNLSLRFRALHSTSVIEYICQQHGFNINTFDIEYANMCCAWNASFDFSCNFDIINIFNHQFIDDFSSFCQKHNFKFHNQIKGLHQNWLAQNENFIR
jgi:hypothetical protein